MSTNYVLKPLNQTEDFAFDSKKQIILLNVKDGFYANKIKYDLSKTPIEEKKIYKLIISSVVLLLILWIIKLKIYLLIFFVFNSN